MADFGAAELDTFRGEVRAWLEANYPAELRKPEFRARIMKEAFATPGPVLIDVVIPKEEAVMPMIPPGGSMSEMLFA